MMRLPNVQTCRLHIQVDFMREQGYLSKKHNRRRDEFVMYVEAHAKAHHLMAGFGAQGH